MLAAVLFIISSKQDQLLTFQIDSVDLVAVVTQENGVVALEKKRERSAP